MLSRRAVDRRAPRGLPPSRTGLGLRSVHHGAILSRKPAVPWYEVISENFMETHGGSGGRARAVLETVRRDTPVALHGVSLSIGSADPLDRDYLRRLKDLVKWIDPVRVSDHLCWTGVGGVNLHDLLPLPYTEETVRRVAERVARVQDFLGRRLLLENVSSYLRYAHSDMTEWACLSEIARRADCGLLLDINNVYVSAVNHGFDPMDFLNGIPAARVEEFHLAGYFDRGDTLIDTHDRPVHPPVWNLYRAAVRRFGAVPTLIEWDDRIPPFDRLWREARTADRIQNETLMESHEPRARAR